MQRISSRPPESSAEATGRRWISRLQRNQRVSSAVDGARLSPGMRSLSTRRPAIVSRVGSRVSAAIMVISTARAVDMATP